MPSRRLDHSLELDDLALQDKRTPASMLSLNSTDLAKNVASPPSGVLQRGLLKKTKRWQKLVLMASKYKLFMELH